MLSETPIDIVNCFFCRSAIILIVDVSKFVSRHTRAYKFSKAQRDVPT